MHFIQETIVAQMVSAVRRPNVVGLNPGDHLFCMARACWLHGSRILHAWRWAADRETRRHNYSYARVIASGTGGERRAIVSKRDPAGKRRHPL